MLGESGSGFPFHQHGEAVLQLMTGRKRWWLLPGSRTPPSGYRFDMSQLKWVQQVLPKLPADTAPQACTQVPGEILYVPDSFWHATLNIGETLAVGAQAGQTRGYKHVKTVPDGGWAQIHKDRGMLLVEVLTAAKQQPSAKQVSKLIKKVEKMLRKYGPNTHLLDAKANLLQAVNPSAMAGSPTDEAFQAAIAADPLSTKTVEKYAKWLSMQGNRFNDGLAVWLQLVELRPHAADPYLFWASMMLMPKGYDGGFNVKAKGLKRVADTLLLAAERVLTRPPQLPWAAGDVIDIDTEDGWERGAKIRGPSESGDDTEMNVEFADGVVDDWAIDDFRRPAPTARKAPRASAEAVIQHACNTWALVHSVAEIAGGRAFIETCQSYGVGLTVTTKDLKKSVGYKANKAREEMKAAINALRAAQPRDA